MLHIYTGREDIDKQRYMFERIKRQDFDADKKQKIFLLVPDQFTLETELSAFTYLNTSAFINPTVLSMNRLAGKVLAEAGENTDHIDRYGKYMLLARLLYRNKSRLELFRNLENSTAFITQLSEAIMSFKAHLITPEKLTECAFAAEKDSSVWTLLGKKLRDVAGIYSLYEEALKEGIPDSTDITRRFAELIPESKMLSDAVVWIYGFDYFSPLYLKAVGAMAAQARDVNIILTAESGNAFFSLTNGMEEALRDAANSEGVEAETRSVENDAEQHSIETKYLQGDEKPPEIAHIEKSLFAGPLFPYAHKEGDHSGSLRFVASAGYYSEAEAAAQTILRLVKEEGFRWRDILVICNDQERRASAVRRVFRDHGIETFIDKRHEAGYNPVLAYITALPEIISRGKRPEDILRWVGTGLTDISEEDIEDLENHMARYGFRDYKAEENVSASIKYIRDRITVFSKRFGVVGSAGGNTGKTKGLVSARKRTEGLRAFLEEDACLPEKVASYAALLEEEGFLEYAALMKGIWDVALEIFTQIDASLGEIETSVEEYATILKVGFSSVMIGVLPASSDAVTIGTMQRTRTGRVKAMFVLGANDGELPVFAEDDGLLDDIEKERLEELGLFAFRREENLFNEEQLGIYKNLSKPSHLLYLSYTAFSSNGKNDTKPSRIFERLRAIFPEIPLEKDSDVYGEISQTEGEAKKIGAIGPDWMRALLPPVLSPTAIEKYSRCPFAFLMERGLKLGSIRKHEIDSRGIGDIYHEALKRFGEQMNEKGGAPVREDSAWKIVGRAETDTLVENVFEGINNDTENISDEGALLFEAEDPAARYRLGRLKSIVKDICWALTESTRASGAERLMFETDFGKGGELGVLNLGDAGLKISGRIDRIDVLPDGRAKVLDYKSGNEGWNSADVKSGWQLQLMLYLKAIEEKYEPAGVSFFRIFEPSVDLSDQVAPEEIDELRMGLYRSDGIAVGEEEEKKTKAKTGEKILSGEEFDELRREAEKRLSEIDRKLSEGEIPAEPKQKAGGEQITACTYCEYLSICNYEPT